MKLTKSGDATVTVVPDTATVPTFFVLMGDWSDLTSGTVNNVLTYRALNLRVNNWSPTAPFDTSFSPFPPPPPPT
ncbi:hypothetical protein [Archangium lansingense]|uniref:Uncharacterized protein n=1 Tax=Archangium lansingense TaxID=2995310 RepID=A0ABT4AB33_9BACT|nr:hypothetical protein [Archangium lansinium]MCY1078885.1 hypothetical protein [Archangium lansinium]